MHQHFVRLGAALLVAPLLTTAASAQIVAKDSFLIGTNEGDVQNYENNVTIRNKEPDEPIGFVSTSIWGGNSSNFLSTSASLGDNPGGKVQTLGVARPDPFGSDLTRYLVRNLEPTNSSTFYMGSLINRGSGLGVGEAPAAVNPDGWVVTGFMNSGSENLKLEGPQAGAGNLFGLTWGFGGNATADGYDIIVRHRWNPAGTGAVGSDIVVADTLLLPNAAANTTYAVLLKFELNANSPDAGRGNDGVTYWVGDLSSFDPSSEASAAATALATGSFASYGFNTSADLTRAVFAQHKYEAGSAFFDEITLAADFASVAAIVPEPASLGLLVLGGLGLLRRRGR
jgi:hypothetical protein